MEKWLNKTLTVTKAIFKNIESFESFNSLRKNKFNPVSQTIFCQKVHENANFLYNFCIYIAKKKWRGHPNGKPLYFFSYYANTEQYVL
jgi:hypothetical protein